MKMFGTVLEHQEVILSIFESPRNIPVSLGNTGSTFVDFAVAHNVYKSEYDAHI